MAWTKFFLTDRKIHLVINRYNNKKKDIEIKILQGSPILPILFLIYINEVFGTITKNNSTVTFLSFIDDPKFIVSETSI